MHQYLEDYLGLMDRWPQDSTCERFKMPDFGPQALFKTVHGKRQTVLLGLFKVPQCKAHLIFFVDILCFLIHETQCGGSTYTVR